MRGPGPYVVVFTPAARRAKLPFEIARAIYEHLSGPVSVSPHRLGKQLDEPLDGVWTTRRGEYRALHTIDAKNRSSPSWQWHTVATHTGRGDLGYVRPGRRLAMISARTARWVSLKTLAPIVSVAMSLWWLLWNHRSLNKGPAGSGWLATFHAPP